MLDRRTFLRLSSAAAGGIVLSLYVDSPTLAQTPASPTYPPDAFVHVRPDGKIVVQVNRLEFGQGIQTALPMILADELDADWSQIIGELAPAADVYKDPIYQLQMTGGSISVPHSFQQYREVGAKMRAMLVATAAERWRLAPDRCRTANSVVYGPANQSARYADLADDAARRPVPGEVRLKTPSEFRLIGTPVRRLDSRAKCDGSLRFGMDVDLPGLKVVLVARPPVYGGRVKSLNDRDARTVAGVRDVFEVPVIRGGTGIAVVADTFWMAKQARDRLSIEWDLSGIERADTPQMQARYTELSRTTGTVAVNRGDTAVLDRFPGEDRIVADFSFPYLAHTPMEPLNTTIRFDGDRAEAWVPSQFQTMDQIAIAEVLGLEPQQVTFHTEYAGGGFGRRTPLDSHVQREAAAIAKHLRGTPVKVVWTREDDVKGGYYRPMFVHHVEVGVDARGMPAAWRHVIVGQSHMIGTGPPWEGALVKNGVDTLVVEGTADTRYMIPNFHVSAHQPTINVPVAQWRSVGMTHNAFVMETLVDELAVRAKSDPIAYRLALLRPDAAKLRNPLVLLDEKTKAWRSRVPRNHAVGIACSEYHDTGVACAVEVSIENNRPRIHRAEVTADVGMAINPLTLEAQFQGGIVYGLSQLMANGAITLSDGRVDQRNFDDHTPPYMKDAPVAITVHIVPSTDSPTACGECPVPVISPALVNALYRLTGKRYRTLPLTSV
jgi:isoquinoline 1-oxidoreductase beta subunit